MGSNKKKFSETDGKQEKSQLLKGANRKKLPLLDLTFCNLTS